MRAGALAIDTLRASPQPLTEQNPSSEKIERPEATSRASSGESGSRPRAARAMASSSSETGPPERKSPTSVR